MAVSRKQPRSRKPADRYHHGDLRRALLDEAVRTIGAQGPAALTLRSVGASLGVSRTALYRHFADKSALLAAVSKEGFRRLRAALLHGWETGGRGQAGFDRMGEAYVQFAIEHPAHYRVMFGGFIDAACADPTLPAEAANAFQVLVDAIVEQQREGVLEGGEEPEPLARFIWALVHGVAMLAIDGQLRGGTAAAESLLRYAQGRIRTGIASTGRSPSSGASARSATSGTRRRRQPAPA